MAVQRLELSGREGIHSVVGYPTKEAVIKPVVFHPHRPIKGVEAAFQRADQAHARALQAHH